MHKWGRWPHPGMGCSNRMFKLSDLVSGRLGEVPKSHYSLSSPFSLCPLEDLFNCLSLVKPSGDLNVVGGLAVKHSPGTYGLWPVPGPCREHPVPVPLSRRHPLHQRRTLFYLTSDIIYWIYDLRGGLGRSELLVLPLLLAATNRLASIKNFVFSSGKPVSLFLDISL